MTAPDPMAAEMVLIRLAHMSDLPTPEELLKQIQKSTPAKNETPSPNVTPTTTGPSVPENKTDTTAVSGAQLSAGIRWPHDRALTSNRTRQTKLIPNNILTPQVMPSLIRLKNWSRWSGKCVK